MGMLSQDVFEANTFKTRLDEEVIEVECHRKGFE